MRIAFDAKRYFHNQRGLGNYSRDVVRILREYAPDWEYQLIDKTGLARSFMHVPQCDIYHGLSGELPIWLPTPPFRGVKRPKTVVTIHDAIFIRYPELYSPSYQWIFTQKVQYACDVANKILAISEQTKKDIIDFFDADPNKIQVLYQGCSNIFRQPVSEQQVQNIKLKHNLPQDYLLIVGTIEERKNIKALIRAIAAAKIDLPLVAVGAHTSYTTEALLLARELGVNVITRHLIPFEDFPAIYKGASLFCFPSIFEGFGIPILESMCVGTPVLTSTGSCFGETGGEAAEYADPFNPEDIAEHLQKILFDTKLREEMSKKGFIQSEKFSDQAIAKNLITMYNSLFEK